jgi:predicted phosphodiesterase
LEPALPRPRNPDVWAVLSDIHGNLEALQAVLADAHSRGVGRVICLGDLVGYGPNPGECIDIIEQAADVCLMGNHDQALLYGPLSFAAAAERSILWTKRTFEQDRDIARRNRRWRMLGNLRTRYDVGSLHFVHGSPRRPFNEYIWPEDIYTAPAKMTGIFAAVSGTCLVGHTHMAGIYTQTMRYIPESDSQDGWPLGLEKAIINVGSVGQPRDRDPRACYVVIDKGHARFVRVEYDVERTVAKIHAVPELDDFLAERLFTGR